MDFFARQDSARKQTYLLLVYFTAAIFGSAALVYFVILIALDLSGSDMGYTWRPPLFLLCFLVTLGVICCGSLLKKAELGGGVSVATQLGAYPIQPNSSDFYERRLRNVIEEMAIASGTPVPQIYVMEREMGINAFAAGYRISDAVIAVTYGTMTGLSRDELQGVIAHEFSHILNGDMRLNLNLVGYLHGLMGITVAGKSAFRLLEEIRGKAGIFIAVAGGGLYCVGSIGFFFAKLIQSLISFQREYLADASAVQFTRNPAGLASALKKIGGLSQGSRLNTRRVDEISHMCFGKGSRNSLFSTHPPLHKRIEWLEPSFKGAYPLVTLESLHAALSETESAPKPKESGFTAASFTEAFLAGSVLATASLPPHQRAEPEVRPNNPEALLASIGEPMATHTEAAKLLIASIPETIREYARDPYGARMLIYFLLLSSDEAVCEKQMALLKDRADPEVFQILEKAQPNIGTILPKLRLPIIDLTISSLRFLSASQHADFRMMVQALTDADGQTDLFEYALQRVLIHHLDPLFYGTTTSRTANYYAIRGLAKEVSVVLSRLAWEGQGNELEASRSFQVATEKIAAPKTTYLFLPREECHWAQLDAALDKLNEASFKVKKWLLGAMLVCLMHDRKISVEETELFRAISDTLGCPVPLWLTPAEL